MVDLFDALGKAVDAAREDRRTTPAEFRPDECEWFPLCTNDAAGWAAHPDHGVIPVCQTHVDAFRIPLITKN